MIDEVHLAIRLGMLNLTNAFHLYRLNTFMSMCHSKFLINFKKSLKIIVSFAKNKSVCVIHNT